MHSLLSARERHDYVSFSAFYITDSATSILTISPSSKAARQDRKTKAAAKIAAALTAWRQEVPQCRFAAQYGINAPTWSRYEKSGQVPNWLLLECLSASAQLPSRNDLLSQGSAPGAAANDLSAPRYQPLRSALAALVGQIAAIASAPTEPAGGKRHRTPKKRSSKPAARKGRQGKRH